MHLHLVYGVLNGMTGNYGFLKGFEKLKEKEKEVFIICTSPGVS